MPSEVRDGAVVSIAEVQREVVVAERVAHLHLLRVRMGLHLRMVCSRLCMLQVVRFL